MKTITKTEILFTAHELKQIHMASFNKALENFKGSQSYFTQDYLNEILADRINYEYGFEFEDLNYSLSHCQGDGVCFKPLSLDLNQGKGELFMEHFPHGSKQLELLETLSSVLDSRKIDLFTIFESIDRTNHRYSHDHSYTFYPKFKNDGIIEVINTLELEDSAIPFKLCNGLALDLTNSDSILIGAIITYYRDVCRKLEREGYKITESNECDDAFFEYCLDNDIYFYSNGTQFEGEI